MAQDHAQAAYWYEKAAQQGNAPAQTFLGIMYEQGRGGLKQNFASAKKLYRAACDQGQQNGCNFLQKLEARGH